MKHFFLLYFYMSIQIPILSKKIKKYLNYNKSPKIPNSNLSSKIPNSNSLPKRTNSNTLKNKSPKRTNSNLSKKSPKRTNSNLSKKSPKRTKRKSLKNKSLNKNTNKNTLSGLSNLNNRFNNSTNNTYRVKDRKKARLNFNELRNQIKVRHDIENTMFRFGLPSKLINDFIYSIYNENIIRLNYYNNDDNFKTNMMSSIVELENKPNTLYITISEEPNSDPDFFKKLGSLLNMIENILFKKKRNNNMLKSNKKYIFKNGNYIYGNGRIVLLNILEEDVNKINKMHYTENYRNFSEKPIFDNLITLPDNSTKTSDYNDYLNLTPDDLKVFFVFNDKYIKERRKFGDSFSFRPFKKTDKDKPDFIACNSGSICSEAKIFSYLYDNNIGGNRLNNIKGAIAYWIGKGTNFGKKCYNNGKPILEICNYHPNYAYETNEDGEDLLDNMIQILKDKSNISQRLLERSSSKFFKNIFRSYALPCPGCYLNKDVFFNNKRMRWDNSMCLEINKTTKKEERILKNFLT